MKRSKIFAGALALLPAAGLLTLTQLADAHHPEIEAVTVCENTTANVTFTVSSWAETDEQPRRVNNDIVVSWDGVPIHNGQFTPGNSYKFTFTKSFPADGTTHVATATAAAAFGPNEEYGFEGEFRSVKVTMPEPCPPAATTTTTAPVVTTTTAPVVTTTTAPQVVQVLGESVTRPAVPVEVLPRFAG
jgi:hypothetical protein